jgi:hypothetical protein
LLVKKTHFSLLTPHLNKILSNLSIWKSNSFVCSIKKSIHCLLNKARVQSIWAKKNINMIYNCHHICVRLAEIQLCTRLLFKPLRSLNIPTNTHTAVHNIAE